MRARSKVDDPTSFVDMVEAGAADRAVEFALDRVRDGAAVAAVIEELLAPVQRLVGERWYRAEYGVAQEHLVSGVVDEVLGLLTTYVPRPTSEHRLLLGCAEGEWHTIPARMAALCLRAAGWRVDFLGGSLPGEHLRASLEQLAPQALLVSCTLPLALPGAAALVQAAHALDVPVLAGGAALVPGRHLRIGADGHAATPSDAATVVAGWLDEPPRFQAAQLDPGTEQEHAVLRTARSGMLEAAYHALEGAGVLARYDERQRQHTRQDLDYILQFLDVALLVDDPRLFDEFLDWLGGILAARGVPPGVLVPALRALSDHLPEDTPRTQDMLVRGRDRLPAGA